jgi:16S rRNA (guanine527-N7)-methyltransferase
VTEAHAETLAETLARYSLHLPVDQVAQLDRYCRLLWQWNQKLNLTRHTDYEKFVSRDVLDSWQLAQLLQPGEHVLDVGTGGGVPGVVLAIVRPDLKVALCESVAKKARAVEVMIQQLNLPIHVYAAPVQDVLRDHRFDVLVARAVGPLAKLLVWVQPHWDSVGRLLAIKGPRWVEERGEARHRGLLKQLQLRREVSYPMPGTDSESVILKIWRGTGADS